MATLQYAESARRITDAAQIATILAPLGITLQTIPVTRGAPRRCWLSPNWMRRHRWRC
jgi:acireductone dioxygenase apoprotein